MTLTSIPFLLAAVAAPVPATGPARVDGEDPAQTLSRQAPPPVGAWAFRLNLIPRFPGGTGAAVDVSRAFGEYFSLEATAGAGDYQRTDFALLARVNRSSTDGGPTLAVGPLLLLDGRIGTVPFAVAELGYTSSRRRGLYVVAALGLEVALANSPRTTYCSGPGGFGTIDFSCPGSYRAGDVGFRSRLGFGVAF